MVSSQSLAYAKFKLKQYDKKCFRCYSESKLFFSFYHPNILINAKLSLYSCFMYTKTLKGKVVPRRHVGGIEE